MPSTIPVDSERERACLSIAKQHGLTAAESRLLFAIASGARLSGYADSAGVRISTVRAHLKGVMRKTGCHRQADIVRAVLEWTQRLATSS